MKRNAILLAVVCFFAVAFARVAAAQKVNVDAPITDANANIAGTYSAVMHIPVDPHHFDSKTPQAEKIVQVQWAFKQDGAKITGTEKTDKGELPFAGTVQGNAIRGVVTDGDQRYTVHLTVDPSDGTMAGSIRMGAREYLLKMSKAK